ncbi:MAG: GTPase HflX, partial [Peptococcaceae bacterium]|nr:GTPase HflX [Peptococcaceae bacterium]
FKATLDELQYADLLLHVIDISNPNFENQLEAVESILRQLKLEEKPRIYVFNKVDRLETLPPIVTHLERESCIYISAATGQNLEELLALMEQKLVQNVTCVVTLPMDKAGLVNQAYASGQVTELEYTDTAVQFVWHGRQEALPHVLAPYTEIK